MKKNEYIKVNKGEFIAYLKVYGKNKLIGEYHEKFVAENDRLYKKDLQEIEEYLILKSSIPEEKIAHTLLDVRQDDSF